MSEWNKCEGAAAGSPFSTEERLVEQKVRAAKRTLAFETLWPRVWLPFSICGVFVLLSAFEVWPLFPPRLHEALLWGFGAAFALSILQFAFWRRPTREQALARLEQASALNHRPLTAFQDKLSHGDASPETAALWRAHRARMAGLLSRLKPGAPHPRVDKYDPFAVRAALILMLAVVAAWQGSNLESRVRAAFIVPEIPPGAGFRIDAWITPPAYTRKDPIVLTKLPASAASSKEPVEVPQGSLLTVKINGTGASGYDVFLGAGRNKQQLKAAPQSEGAFAEYGAKLEQAGTLSIQGGYGSGRSWSFNVIPDQPPTIAFSGPIEISRRAVMLFKYKVADDYGVVSAEAHVDRTPSSGETPGGAPQPALKIGKPPVFPLSLPHAPTKSAEAKTYRDLTAHPWAGLPVVVTLTAKDEAGHEGQSSPRGLILPERKFAKPLAKAVIGQRRDFVENPSNALSIANNLDALAVAAEDDGLAPSIYLSLRTVYWRLHEDMSIEDMEGLVDQLWDVAVRIEDGNLTEAERELRAAQDRLKDALERGAPQEEIRKLMGELRQALNKFLEAMASRNDNGDKSASSRDTKTVTSQELQKMLDKIENLTKSGSAEAAEKMLSELRDILESLQTAQQNGGGSDEESNENAQRLDKLTGLMRQQQRLLDQTFRAQQQGDENSAGERGQRGSANERSQQGMGQQAGGSGQPGAAQLREEQADIQRQLNELMSQMSSGKGSEAVKRKLKEAESAMDEAGAALGDNQLGQATDQEGQALEGLRQGTRALAEQMMQSGKGSKGMGQASVDPLGRQNGGQIDPGDSVKVPEEIDVQRAREILDELRKRLGQPSRPPVELDYLERLIKPF